MEWMVGLHVCLCTTCMSGVERVQKNAQDSWELEVPGDVSHHVGAGNHTLLFYKSSHDINHSDHRISLKDSDFEYVGRSTYEQNRDARMCYREH